MKTWGKELHSELISVRVDELDKDLLKHDDFRSINEKQNYALQDLKKLIGENNWIVLDEYVCAKNAECEYIMNYFYINGLKDRDNIFS